MLPSILTSEKMLKFFFYEEESFNDICKRKRIKPQEIRNGVAILLSYPLMSRKKMADKISRMLDIDGMT